MAGDPQILFLVVILPLLFASSLILEGVIKLKREQSGVIELVLGGLFVILILAGYWFVLR